MGEHTNSASTKAKNAAASSMVAAAAAGSTVTAAAVNASGHLQQHLQEQQLQQQQQQASTSGSAGLTPSTAKDVSELQEIRNLLWGPVIRLDVFRRWSQGGWWT